MIKTHFPIQIENYFYKYGFQRKKWQRQMTYIKIPFYMMIFEWKENPFSPSFTSHEKRIWNIATDKKVFYIVSPLQNWPDV